MRRLHNSLPVALAAGLLTVTGVNAHHSFTQFDRTKEFLQTGTVVRRARMCCL